MPIDKAKSTVMTFLSFLCFLVMAVPVVAHSSAGGAADLSGTDSKGSYSHDKGQIQKGSSVGHGFMPRKSEGSRSKSSHHLSGNKSPKTYSPGKSGHGYSYKKSEGSGSKKSYSHGRSGHGSGRYKSEGSYSKSYRHGKSGYRGRGYSKGHGHVKSPFTHLLRFKNELGLTAEQIDKIKNLRFEYKKVKIQAGADHQIAHLELDRLVHSATVDETGIRAAGAKIAAANAKKIMAMIEAKVQLLNLLTAEQRKKMSGMHSAH